MAITFGVGRRVADTAIQAGEIIVDGVLCQDLSTRIVPGATLMWHGRSRTLALPEAQYWLWYKPRGVECTFSPLDTTGTGLPNLDPWLQKDAAMRYGGRLDVESEGLLLLSTDGRWLDALTHPSRGFTKRYEVTLDHANPGLQDDRELVETDLGQISKGRWRPLDQDFVRWEVFLQDGQNRHIRRVAEAYGSTVWRLLRTHVGPFGLESLDPGASRQLSSGDAWAQILGQ